MKGQMINATNTKISTQKSRRKRSKSAKITKLFMNIPIALEKPTNPCRYSFFQGLKYVFKRRGRENSSKKALFNEAKKLKREIGASINQNFKKFKGNKNIPAIGS